MTIFLTWCFFVLGAFAAEQSVYPLSSDCLLDAVRDWVRCFDGYVGRDPGYVYCLEKCSKSIDTCACLDDACYESVLCKHFSNLRCATCYAMALCDNVSYAVFCEAVERCRDSEVYQVFMAADSSFKNEGADQKIQKLKEKVATFKRFEEDVRPLLQTGAILQTLPWTRNVISAHKQVFEHIYLEKTHWLHLWYSGKRSILQQISWRNPNVPRMREVSFPYAACALQLHTQVTSVQLPHTVSQYDVLFRLSQDIGKIPYVLHHLEKQDFARYAYVWIPALYDSTTNSTWSELVQNALPTVPHLRYLADIITETQEVYQEANMALMRGGMEEDSCKILVEATWDFFATLKATVTINQWNLCVSMLHQIPWVGTCLRAYPYVRKAIFQFRVRHRIYPEPDLAQSERCDARHVQHFLRKRADLIEKIAVQLDLQHQDDAFAHVVDECDYRATTFGLPCLLRQHVAIQALLLRRCNKVWEMAGVTPPHAHFWVFYNACTRAEKLYLFLRAEKQADLKRLTLLTFNDKLDNTKHLERISCSLSEEEQSCTIILE